MLAELYDQISAIIDAPDRDLKRIERTLTDGYARALSLEAEKSRIQKRITEVTQELEHGDTVVKARELSTLARRLDGNEDELTKLRGRARRAAPARRRDSRLARPLDDPGAHCVDRRLDAVLDLQLHQDVRDVVLDRLRADVQLAAIIALSWPFAISFRTSISRSDSSDWISSASRCDALDARTR